MKYQSSLMCTKLIAVIIFFTFAGCAAEPARDVEVPDAEQAISAAKTLQVKLKDDGKTLEAAPGQAIEIQLEANPSTGFDWYPAHTRPLGSKAKKTFRAGPLRAGAAGITVFSMSSTNLTTGNHPLAFEYRRATGPIAKRFVVTVEARATMPTSFVRRRGSSTFSRAVSTGIMSASNAPLDIKCEAIEYGKWLIASHERPCDAA